MQLYRISHYRCDEFDSYEYVLFPDDWSDEKIKKAIDDAELEALSAAKAYSEFPIPPELEPFMSYGYYTAAQPNYKNFPDKTVAEVNKLHSEAGKLHEEWMKERNKIRRSFVKLLEEMGATSINDESVPEVTVNWGHRHGMSILYGTDSVPYKTIEQRLEFEDDD